MGCSQFPRPVATIRWDGTAPAGAKTCTHTDIILFGRHIISFSCILLTASNYLGEVIKSLPSNVFVCPLLSTSFLPYPRHRHHHLSRLPSPVSISSALLLWNPALALLSAPQYHLIPRDTTSLGARLVLLRVVLSYITNHPSPPATAQLAFLTHTPSAHCSVDTQYSTG